MKISKDAIKVTRAEAHTLIVDAKTGRRELGPNDIDSLLLYFSPTLPRKATTVEQWVAKAAAGPQEEREFLRYLHVKNGVVSASDGYRAHRGATKLDDGYYEPRSLCRLDFDGTFQSIDRVFPDRGGLVCCAIGCLTRGSIMNEKKGKTKTYQGVSGGVSVDEVFLIEALNDKDFGFIYHDPGSKAYMVGGSEFGEWVIAGMRV